MIPGIDQMGAAMLLAEIGIDMGRFGSKEGLCSWAGMCPGNNESAGKKRAARPRRATGMFASYYVSRPTAPIRPTVNSKDFSKGS
ncbi:MAG: transposase [Desulfobacteraceae bacterium]